MNYTLAQLVELNEPILIYKENDNTNNLISSISLAICSILLSLTGFLAMLHQSKCKNIKFGCLRCDRDLTSNSV